jgi:acetyl-CoA carboxylase biotin carboxylase subunit
VTEQIRIAAGEPVSFLQEDVALSGHAIECRINAEDASRGFAPGPGRLAAWSMPQGEGLRVDTHCFEGYLVPPFYDSLLAKVIAHGSSRAEAIARMDSALARCRIEGVPTTVPFHREVMAHEDFRAARVTTRWVEETLLAREKVAA